ncbi:MAG: wax ester/triacylglycerol synthase family O-acyltransferase [Kofleriaceae bacterium]|nr:wax ester/triacylglycerol synthase family O-acyltransferase [Kofleriaceae bacterium]
MARADSTVNCERLSALDATFLEVETRESPMGIGAICVFAGGSMVSAEGTFDTVRLRAHIAQAIVQLPRYRQRLAMTPLIGQPVWIDDDRFNLDFHVRYTRLPVPGDDRQLQRLAARLFSQQIDRSHPLWELYCVEGLSNQRFAIIAKVHHCMADGVAGVGLLSALLQPTISVATPDAPPAWQPRAVPSRGDLIRAEVQHRNDRTWNFVRAVTQRNRRDTVDSEPASPAADPTPERHGKSPARAVVNGMYDILRAALQRRIQTPLTPDSIGGARRFDTARISLEEVRSVAHSLGGTVNDVVLTLVAGALRSFLIQRGLDPGAIGALRAMIPVNLRTHGGSGDGGGNQLALLLTELPIHQAEPLVRHQLVRAATDRLKHQSDQIAASAFFSAVADAAATSMLSKVFHLAVRMRAFDVVVTNVRGPRETLFLGDAAMTALYPMVPLYERQAIGVAVFGYAGVLHIGLSAAWDLVPDLHDVALEFEREIAGLRAAAAATH